MSDGNLVKSILLFNKKYQRMVKEHRSIRYNGKLDIELQKQLDSIVKQAKKLD